jgi:hypothetical protein
MIAELVAFNAAFGVVKQFISNGKDLTIALAKLVRWSTAKEDMKARQQKEQEVFVCI